MSLTLLAPVSLAQAAAGLARQQLRVAGLEALLARATIAVTDKTLDDTLAALLGIERAAPTPFAPLRLASEGVQFERDAYWLCADPVSTTLLIDNAEVGGCVADLTREDADALVAACNAAFGNDGLEFIAPDPSRWYVRCATQQEVSTTPLWRAIGHSMRDALPAGYDGPRWRARLNETQMLLHAHPVNEQREARGLARVGSLWWWGGGSWPAFGVPEVDRVIGEPRWATSACAANHVAHEEMMNVTEQDSTHRWLAAARNTRVLCIAADDWESAAYPAAKLAEWDRHWFQPLSAALDDGRIDTATLHFGWADRTLRAECAPRKPTLRQRLFGARAPKPVPSIEALLEAVEQ